MTPAECSGRTPEEVFSFMKKRWESFKIVYKINNVTIEGPDSEHWDIEMTINDQFLSEIPFKATIKADLITIGEFGIAELLIENIDVKVNNKPVEFSDELAQTLLVHAGDVITDAISGMIAGSPKAEYLGEEHLWNMGVKIKDNKVYVEN